MNSLKKYIALVIALVVPFAAVSAANAADETVNATTDISARSGPLYKEKAVPSNLKINVDVTTPVSSPKVLPMKNVKVTFPTGMTFNPNNAKTPVCPDSKLSNSSNLAAPSAVVSACKDSVIGTGTATIIIGKINNNPALVVSDPILVAFNAGKNAQGQPKLKIYGYSAFTKVGILMDGTLKGSVLDIAIPVLSSDSAVKDFKLEFPGPKLDRPELGISTQGRDANYVLAKCASSPLATKADFILGERTYPGGEPTSPDVPVSSPETFQDCVGNPGKAKLGGVKVKGPNAVKNGRKGTFKVTVTNNGTATAKNVVVTSNRGGKGKGGNIAPGKSKTVTVKATIRGKKNRKVAVKFTAKSGNVKAAATKKVTVR
jgi:hypothetical protein